MLDQASYLLMEYPWLRDCVTVMIVCRIAFKPTFQILSKYVELTVDKDDDKKLNKFMQSKTYKMLSFIVDTLASVKLPQIKKEK